MFWLVGYKISMEKRKEVLGTQNSTTCINGVSFCFQSPFSFQFYTVNSQYNYFNNSSYNGIL